MDTSAITTYWPVAVGTVIAVISSVLLIRLTLWVLHWRYLLDRDLVWLEMTPPASIEKTPEATEQLFTVLHGLRSSRTLRERLLGREPHVSFEIVSTKAEGIRYRIACEAKYVKVLHKMLTSYVPDAKIRTTAEQPKQHSDTTVFKQSGHYVMPLTLTSLFEGHDPLGYVMGAMTKLGSDESITLQLVTRPVRLREASTLAHKILGNENILSEVSSWQMPLFGRISRLLANTLNGMTSLTSEVYMGTTYGHKNYYDSKQKQLRQQMPVSLRDRPARTLSAFELELMQTMHQKVSRPLFRTDIRLLITSPQPKEHRQALQSSLDGLSVPPYQELRVKKRLPYIHRLNHALGYRRLPSLFQKRSSVLSVAELAALYHVPSRRMSKTDNLASSLSRTLPAPLSLKSGQEIAVMLGENHHHGVVTPIGLTEAERERHVYVIGGTGNGKTTMLFYSILQDIRAGNGVAILDPHGDLAERLLRYIPESRIADVIYMNPDDLMYPIGVNLLELPEGIEGDDLLREKDLVTEATISVLRKIFSEDDSGGHRIEYVLRNAIQTSLTLENPTLFTIFELLNDTKFRRKVVKDLKDKHLKDFWDNELGKAGEFQRVKMAAGITAKIGRFLFSGSAKRVLEQPKSTIDFEDILASRKILICNFSKGLLGEDTSTLFGTTVLAKLQTAALRRARIGQDDRVPFYLYVDEFQNFATMSFVQMLSEARKYKLFLTMAEQSTSQQDQQRLVDIILANVGTVVCFRSGSPADERYVLPLFSPSIEQGEIANLPAYSYYVRIAAVQSQEPMSGMTVVVTDDGNKITSQRVIESSRQLYAKKQDVEQRQHTIPKPVEEKPKPARSRRGKREANENHLNENSQDSLSGAKSFR